jgi:hypothetical protein
MQGSFQGPWTNLFSGLGFSASSGHPNPPSLSGEGKEEWDNVLKILVPSTNARHFLSPKPAEIPPMR